MKSLYVFLMLFVMLFSTIVRAENYTLVYSNSSKDDVLLDFKNISTYCIDTTANNNNVTDPTGLVSVKSGEKVNIKFSTSDYDDAKYGVLCYTDNKNLSWSGHIVDAQGDIESDFYEMWYRYSHTAYIYDDVIGTTSQLGNDPSLFIKSIHVGTQDGNKIYYSHGSLK
ncbi:hypothetical protein JQC92_01850 [Shewanella sp. 202IG2-18]|uniref:hypothetical protein n=1 Tax=Parashewanella hymeniacidonis TaxID=2807618 RepID=UPI00195FCCEC|nr:hypothetical protein [Parashewanella hymeniacidonis]MBM7070786.1 hypothetical protein [Parashewanella hymeniacidonis]